MSLPWSELNPALLALFTELGRGVATPTGGTVGPVVEHAGRPRKIMSALSKQALTMQVLSARGGSAWVTRDFDQVAQSLTERVEQDDFYTFRLACDALANNDVGWAWTTIGNIRARLRFTSVLERLLALNCEFLRCSPAAEVKANVNGRLLHRVVMDVVMLVHVTEVEEPEVPGTWIDSVYITSDKIRDADGEPLPEALQMNEVLVDGTADEP